MDSVCYLPSSPVPALPQLRTSQQGAQPAVRYEALADDQGDLSRAADRYSTNEPVLNHMLDASTTDDQRQDIQRDLGVLPPALLKKAQEQGVQIYVVPEGTTEVPARLFKQDVDPAGLTAEWKNYHRQDDQFRSHQAQNARVLKHDPAYQKAVQKHFENVKAQAPVGGGFSAAMGNEQKNIDDLLQIEADAMKRNGLSAGPMPPLQPSGGIPTRVADAGSTSASTGPQAGDTWESVARQHGAATPQEIKEFADLARVQNPSGAPHLQAGQTVVVPDLNYRQGKRFSRNTLHTIDEVNQATKRETVDGVYNSSARILAIKSRVLPDPNPRTGHHRVILHEFGHVTENLIESDPSHSDHYQTLKRIHENDGNEDYGMAHRTEADGRQMNDATDSPFVTGYSRESAVEHYADGFEAYFTADRTDGVVTPRWMTGSYDSLRSRDAGLFDLIDSDVRSFDPDMAPR